MTQKKMVKKLGLTFFFLALVLPLALASCAPEPEVTEVSTLRIGTFPIVDLAPVYLGDELGYFEEEGITIEYVPQFGAQGIPVLEAGDMDINASESIGTVQAISQGFDITIVAGMTKGRTGAPESATIMVLGDSGIAAPQDLVGKTMAIYAFESSSSLVAEAWLEKNGVDPSEVTFTELGFHLMPDALMNGQVDAIFDIEPFRTALLDTGQVTALAYPDIEVHAGWDIAQFVAKADWVEAHPVATKKFATVVARTIDWINANEAEARKMIAAYAQLDPAMADAILLPVFSAQVSVDSMQDTAQLMSEHGMLDTQVDIASHVYETALGD